MQDRLKKKLNLEVNHAIIHFLVIFYIKQKPCEIKAETSFFTDNVQPNADIYEFVSRALFQI